jgi:hypothetical protein
MGEMGNAVAAAAGAAVSVTERRVGGTTAPWVGIEHEYSVAEGERPIDFRALVDDLEVGRPDLDPGDPHARRARWGGVVTADGPEAEIATPPVTAQSGFAHALDRCVTHGIDELRRSLPQLTFDGYSTHINVEVPDRLARVAARRFVAQHALPMMLLLDRRSSPGLLVRPRRHRLELCGDHVAGDQLVAATVFAAAATLDARRVRCAPGRRSPRPGVVEEARERYGWYVDRAAFGVDLYRHGRRTRLPDGTTAQDHLWHGWERVRPVAAGLCAPAELEIVDATVEGRIPLPCEQLTPARRATAPADATAAGPFARALLVRHRAGLVLEPRIVTWPLVVLAVQHPSGEVLLSIPGKVLGDTLDRLDRGELDGFLYDALARRGTLGPVRPQRGQGRIAVHDRIEDVRSVVPTERDLVTGRVGGSGGSGREAKERSDDPSRPRPRKALPRVVVFAGLAALVAVLAAVAAVAATGGGSDEGRASGTSTTSTAVELGPEEFPAETARDLGGTYVGTGVFVDGNPLSGQSVGESSPGEITLMVECQADRCTVEVEGIGRARRVGQSLVFEYTSSTPCETDPGVGSVDENVLTLALEGPDRLVGEQTIVTVDDGGCPDVVLDPVTLRWDLRREG